MSRSDGAMSRYSQRRGVAAPAEPESATDRTGRSLFQPVPGAGASASSQDQSVRIAAPAPTDRGADRDRL